MTTLSAPQTVSPNLRLTACRKADTQTAAIPLVNTIRADLPCIIGYAFLRLSVLQMHKKPLLRAVFCYFLPFSYILRNLVGTN